MSARRRPTSASGFNTRYRRVPVPSSVTWTRPQLARPIKHVIASPALNAEQVEAVRDYLLTLDASEEGRKKLAPTKYTGFDRYDQAALLALGTWLGL